VAESKNVFVNVLCKVTRYMQLKQQDDKSKTRRLETSDTASARCSMD